MAMDHNPSGRRPHYHRGRRGMERRGSDRRTPQQSAEQSGRTTADQVDVEQIMRDIRARISQRHGIELSPQQIQDLAARRLESILDPRTVSPTLIEQLRKGASVAPDPLRPSSEADYSFNENAIYDTDSGFVRFFRRLLNPLLKLLFNPAPIVAALQTQARVNREAAARVVESERRQAEWNALHYQILQRLVTEVSRVTIEMQALNARVESLGARVDFNDRRVRSIEAAPAPNRSPRERAEIASPPPAAAENAAPAAEAAGPPSIPSAQPSDSSRRRRRRRRGRRGSVSAEPGATGIGNAPEPADEGADVVEGDDDEASVVVPPGDWDTTAPVIPPSPVGSETSTPEPTQPTPVADEPAAASPSEPNPFSFMPQPAATRDEAAPAVAPGEPPEPDRSES
jgi:hypothetical protein